MHVQTGPVDLPGRDQYVKTNTPGRDRHHDNLEDGMRRLALFYLAHWPHDRLAAIMPTLRKHAVIPPETQ